MKKKMLKKPIVAIVCAFLLVLGALFLWPAQLFAQGTSSDTKSSSSPDSSTLDLQQFNNNLNGNGSAQQAGVGTDCGGVKIAFNVGCRDDFSNPILAYLVAILRFLTYGVGIVVTLMIVIGGVQYAAAGDNSQSVAAAKSRIFNAVIALLLYIFAFAILNFIVPGGLIG